MIDGLVNNAAIAHLIKKAMSNEALCPAIHGSEKILFIQNGCVYMFIGPLLGFFKMSIVSFVGYYQRRYSPRE